MKLFQLKTKYHFTLAGVLVYYILLLAVMFLFFGRSYPAIRLPFPERWQVYSHMSNFCISYLLTATVLFILLLQDARWKLLLIIGCAMILINLIVETFVTVGNVPDELDALAGAAGVFLAWIVIAIIKKAGLKLAPRQDEATLMNYT